jgi:hypothetical protein
MRSLIKPVETLIAVLVTVRRDHFLARIWLVENGNRIIYSSRSGCSRTMRAHSG